MEWVYNLRRPNRSFDRAAERNFTYKIESLIRESIQNSTDARERALDLGLITENDPTEVYFQLLRLVGWDRRNFLENIHANSLSTHLKSSKQIKTEKKVTEYFNYDNTSVELEILAIHDANTIGLMGRDIPKGEEDSPFAALCRDSGLSNKGNISGKGGSYGMGKSVFWKFSEFNSVMFLSYTEHPKEKNLQYRLFGLTDMGPHELQGYEYDGIAEFGSLVDHESDENVTGAYAKSIWATNINTFNFLPHELLNIRKNRRGTTIIILGFSEFDECYTNFSNISYDVYKWFWPLFQLKKLHVEILNNNGNTKKLSLQNLHPSFLPFSDIFATIIEKNPGNLPSSLKKSELNVAFPQKGKTRKSVGLLNSKGFLFLKNVYDFDPGIDLEYKNRIAWMRGAFTIVKYDHVPNPGGADPYFGLLVVGTAIKVFDSMIKNVAEFDEFLRFSETPSHDDWNYERSKLREEYKIRAGAKKQLKDMKRKFKDLSILLDTEINDNNNMPSVLRNLLPTTKITKAETNNPPALDTERKGQFVGGGGNTKKEFYITPLLFQRNNNTIIVKFNIEKEKEGKTWDLKIRPFIVDERGNKIGELYAKIEILYNGTRIRKNIISNLHEKKYEITVIISDIPKEFHDSEIVIDIKGK